MSETNEARDPKTGRFKKGFSGNPTGVHKKEDAVPDFTARVDGWASALTGIGDVSRDKRMSHSFLAPTMTYQDIVELWRGDDIARRAIEAPPNECLREGYELTIADEGQFDDLKDAVEQKLLDLQVNKILKRAFSMERAFGGAAILLGVKDNLPLDKPLQIDRVQSLEWLTVLEPVQLYPSKFYDDPASPKYGEPEFWTLNTSTVTAFGGGGSTTVEGRAAPPSTRPIHESRLIVFPGLKVSQFQTNAGVAGAYWGDSLLLSLVEVLRDFNVAWHSAGIIATDFAQPVLQMENLMALVAKQPEKVAARTAALELQRSTARPVLIDAKEKYDRQSTSIAGLPDLLNQLSMRLAAAIDMPLSLLMGQGPSSLGNETENDVRFYYDRIRGIQQEKFGPVLRFLINMIMRTLRQRKLPKRWGVRFHPLWQLTDQQKAEARLAQARVDSMYIKMGAVSPDEIRIARFGGEYSWDTPIDENKPAPGIPEIQLAMWQSEQQMKMAEMAASRNPNPNQGNGKTSGGMVSNGVKGYTRRNPNLMRKMVPAAKEGGDVAPRDNRDGDGPAKAIRIVSGLRVVIESPKGSVRTWKRPDGSEGSTKMRYDYGYIEGAIGSDVDSLDAYVGPSTETEWVYIIDQMKAPDFAEYDEQKVMLGFDSPNHAEDAYKAQYDDERFFGGMTVMHVAVFKRKLAQQGMGKVVLDDAPIFDFFVEREGKWYVLAESGKVIGGPYDTREEAARRLAQIEYFRNKQDGMAPYEQLRFVEKTRAKLAARGTDVNPTVKAYLDALWLVASDEIHAAHLLEQCGEDCPFCAAGPTAEVKVDVKSLKNDDIDVCSSCGDMMMPGKVHECGAPDEI